MEISSELSLKIYAGVGSLRVFFGQQREEKEEEEDLQAAATLNSFRERINIYYR